MNYSSIFQILKQISHTQWDEHLLPATLVILSTISNSYASPSVVSNCELNSAIYNLDNKSLHLPSVNVDQQTFYEAQLNVLNNQNAGYAFKTGHPAISLG